MMPDLIWVVCDLCGAVVANEELHGEWHEAVTPPQEEVAPDGE